MQTVDMGVFIGEVSLQNLLLFVFAIIFSVLAGNILRIIVVRLLKGKTKPMVYKTLSKAVMYLSYFAGFYLAFQKILNFSIPAFLAALGILGITFLLIMLPALQNIFAGIVLSLERPLKENDIVEVDGTVCIVKDVTLRKTVLRSLDGKIIIAPNMKFITDKIINYSSGEFIRAELSINIKNEPGYERATEIIHKILIDDSKVLPHIPKKELNMLEKLFTMPKNLEVLKPQVFVRSIGKDTINLQVWFWIWDILKKESITSNFYKSLTIEFRRNNISFG